jgi:predicted MFS family arabinose efflux permease
MTQMRPAQTDQPVSPPPPLWRNLRFQALWIGMTSSTLGVSVADIAYPLLILVLTGSPAQAGLFAAVQAFAMLAAGLPAGSLADRFDPRQIVLVTETCRALVTSLVVIALITGWLSLPLLLVAAALLGIGQGTCNPARILLLYAVVPGEQLTVALAQDQVRTNGASMAGPALGGALYSIRALSHAAPFVVTAVSFVVSLMTTAMLPRHTTYPKKEQSELESGAPGDGGMLAGLRFVWHHPVLRPAMVLIAIVNTVGVGLDLILIVLLRHQGVPSSEIGLALGVAYAGSIVGIPLIKLLHRLRPGVLMIGVAVLLIPIFALLSLPFGPWWAAALLFVALLSLPAIQVAVEVLAIKQTPEDQRGRVAAAFMTLVALGVPAGLAGCGLLLQFLPAQAALLTLAAILAVGVGYCVARPGLWQARWPD